MNKMILIAAAAALMIVLTGCSTDRLSAVPSVDEDDGSKMEETTSVPQTENLQIEETTSIPQTEESDSLNEASAIDSQIEQAFTSMEIEVEEGTLYIRSGDAFSLTYHNGNAADYDISNNTLYYKNRHTGDTVLVLPENESYETLHLIVDDGHAYVENSVTVRNLKLEVEQGEAKLEKVFVSDNSFIKVEQGSAFVSGDLGDSVNASCKEGHLSLEVPFKQTECSYEIDLTEGDIRMGNEHYQGRSESRTVDNGGERFMKLTCSRGDISVEFEKAK